MPCPPRQGRLPEIDVLQGQLTAAHEALSDERFRAEELRTSGAAREQQVRRRLGGSWERLGAGCPRTAAAAPAAACFDA